MDEKQVAGKNKLPLLIVGLLIVIIAVWFIVTRRETTTLIQPASADTVSSATGIPPDSLHH